jgi:hypothetical protein
MKITNVSVTMFNWKSEAWRTGTGAFGGHRLLGVVTVHTDEPSRYRHRPPSMGDCRLAPSDGLNYPTASPLSFRPRFS